MFQLHATMTGFRHRNWFFLVVITICFVFWPPQGQARGQSGSTFFNPPILNVASPHNAEVNKSLKLECEGRYPLAWKFPELWEFEIKTVVNVSSKYDPNRVTYQHLSILEIPEAKFTYTGWYICYYEGTNKPQESRGNAASVYVFVNDPENLFVLHPQFSHHWFFSVREGTETNLPCLPTSPKVNVTLWKNENGEELVPLGDAVSFDPMYGFVLSFPDNYFEGLFYCRGELDDVTEELYLTLFFLPEIVSSPIPHIEKSSDYVPVNGSFTLTCMVRIHYGVKVFVEWLYPNQNDSPRITQTNHSIETAETGREYSYQIVSRQLIVNNVQKSDEGTYTCNVTDHSSKTNQQEIYITVYENPAETTINVTTDINTLEPLEMDAGENVLLVVSVDTFPKTNDYSIFWLKDEHFISADHKRYKISRTGRVNKLNITNAVLLDAGVYTVVAEYGNAKSNLSITLKIRDKPHMVISSHPSFFLYKKQYSIDCQVEGYPAVNVWWRWMPCPSLNCSTETYGWKDVEADSLLPNNATTSLVPNNNRANMVIQRLNVIPQESGYYKCQANNKLGEVQDAIVFRVSDAVDGFDIKECPKYPVDRDGVTLSCYASVYNFTSLRWYWRSVNGTVEPVTNGSGVYLLPFTTQYSHALTLVFESISLNNSGEYVCSAWKDQNSSISQNISCTLSVQEIIKPYIVHTNMDGSTVTIDQTLETEFTCNVSGRPPPVITWLKNGELFDTTNMSGVEISNRNRTLLIKRVMESDEGRYECIGKNKGGAVSANLTLVVISDPTAQPLENKLTEGQIAGIVTAFIVFVILVAILCVLLGKKVYQDKKHQKDLEFINHALFDRGQVEMFNPDLPLEEQAELLPYDHHWEFPKDRLKLGKTLGQGAFGRVVKAEAIGLDEHENTTTVAVKMLKERANLEHQKALMAELKILIHLGRHLNIVNLLGAVTKNIVKGELMVIVEYCRFGNLRHYLLCQRDKFINQMDPITGKIDPNICTLPNSPTSIKEMPIYQRPPTSPGVDNPIYRDQSIRYTELLHRSVSSPSASTDPGDSTDMTGASYTSFRNRHGSMCYRGETKDIGPVSTCDLICYAFQCARGMEYLAAKKLIHRDLAARNVLLAEDNIVKICDFGLAKDCYKYSNYVKKGNGPLPVKWMAIESIRDKVFTIKSDVWSFGVLLWEMFTLGGNPYPGIEINEEFYKKLKDGYRMEKPELAPDVIYEIMQHTWQADPKDRPEFSELAEKIGNLLEEGVRKYYIDLNGPYAQMNEISNNNDYLMMDGKGDYMNMKAEREPSPGAISDEGQLDTLLSKDNPQAHYKNVGAIRPVGDGPVPKVPMEVVPMIQLESPCQESKFSGNGLGVKKSGKMKGPPPALPPAAAHDHLSDYLLMSSPGNGGETKSITDFDDGNDEGVFTGDDGGLTPPPYDLVSVPKIPVLKV